MLTTPQPEFGSVKNVEVTVLVDNRIDLLLQSTDRVRYFNKKLLLAEQGFSLLIEVNGNQKILLDTGTNSETLQENMRRMGIDPTSIALVALSHGHSDHAGSMSRILRDIIPPLEPENRGNNTKAAFATCDSCDKFSIFAHPVAFKERWRIYKDGSTFGPLPVPNKKEWEALGAQIISTETPHKIIPGGWLTGFIPRLSFETQSGSVYKTMYRDNDELVDDVINDDQAFVLNVEGKGLVIISGCAHAGIINTINYARQISGINEVYAVIGGFHLAFSNKDEIEKTVTAFEEYNIGCIAPLHCTGFLAQAEIYNKYPDNFLQVVVGATVLL